MRLLRDVCLSLLHSRAAVVAGGSRSKTQDFHVKGDGTVRPRDQNHVTCERLKATRTKNMSSHTMELGVGLLSNSENTILPFFTRVNVATLIVPTNGAIPRNSYGFPPANLQRVNSDYPR
jgi:hypothetical protein